MVTEPPPNAGRKLGRPPMLSREIIADTAIGIIADEGADALTLQRVAGRLGVKHPALYRHVKGRADLLRAVADRFMETSEWPEPQGDWRAYLRAVAKAIDVNCGRVPGMMDLIYNQVWPLPRQLMRTALQITENLVALGFPRPLALMAADIVGDFAADARVRKDRVAQHATSWGGFTAALGDDTEHDEQRQAFEAQFEGRPEQWSGNKIDIILDGIEAQLARSREQKQTDAQQRTRE